MRINTESAKEKRRGRAEFAAGREGEGACLGVHSSDGREELQSSVAAQAQVFGLVDFPHATGAQFA